MQMPHPQSRGLDLSDLKFLILVENPDTPAAFRDEALAEPLKASNPH